MAVKTYNKLVRDLIPDIIEQSGKECRTRILSDDEYLEMIDKKLDEELADLLELIHAAAMARGYTIGDLEAVRAEKSKSRGGFEKKIYLIDVIE